MLRGATSFEPTQTVEDATTMRYDANYLNAR